MNNQTGGEKLTAEMARELMRLPFNERISSLLAWRRIRKAEISRRMSVSPQAVQNWVEGNNQMSETHKSELAEILGVPEWVIKISVRLNDIDFYTMLELTSEYNNKESQGVPIFRITRTSIDGVERTEPKETTCINCKWWVKLLGGGEVTNSGECRRNPPRENYNGFPLWVITKTDHWCGEFDPSL